MQVRSNVLAGAACLAVLDLKKSVEWYQDCLGFSAPDMDWASNPKMCLIERDGGVLLLQKATRTPTANRHCQPGSTLSDIYFWVKDLDRLALEIKVSGNEPYAGPIKRNYGTTELMIIDPDDYLICFGQH